MFTILVTGGAGYIGSHTCVELLNAGYEVVVVDNLSNSSFESIKRVESITLKKIKFYKCDIRDKEGLSRIFLENKIDSVIHFAGLKSVNESCQDPVLYFDNNISGTIVLCEIMQKFGVKSMVFSSSATVYGNTSTPPCKEDMPTGDVNNPYGRTKYFIEAMLEDIYRSDNSWSIALLRYFNTIGAHSSGLIGEDPNGIPNNLMPYISQVAIGKLPFLTVFGDNYDTPDGTCVRDYIHVVDLAKGHLCAIKRVLSSNGIDAFNLGTGKGYSVLELIKAFEKASNKKTNYIIGPKRQGDIACVFADPSKAKNELNFEAKFDIYKMCQDTFNWQEKNPNGYSK